MDLEEYFKQAVAGLRDKQLSAYPEHTPQHTFSPAFEKNRANTTAQQRRRSRAVTFRGAFQRVTGFVLAFILGLGTCVFSISPWGSRFFEQLGQPYPDHTSIFFRESRKSNPHAVNLIFTIETPPEGFHRVGHKFNPNGFLNSIEFEDDQEHSILLEQIPADSIGIPLNVEGSQREEIEFWGQKAQYLYNRGLSTLLWYDGRSYYMLTTNFPKEKTLEIAHTVQVKSRPYPTLQSIPIERLPEDYTVEMARANGDVILLEGVAENVGKLESFVASCDAGKDDVLRIVEFVPEGHALIRDLQMEKGHLYYTYDEHRWSKSEQPWTVGEEYERISIMPGADSFNLLLYTYRYDKPTQVVQYKLPISSGP